MIRLRKELISNDVYLINNTLSFFSFRLSFLIDEEENSFLFHFLKRVQTDGIIKKMQVVCFQNRVEPVLQLLLLCVWQILRFCCYVLQA